MLCPICGGELNDDGPYGYLALHQSGKVLGRIYECENREGFESEELSSKYLKRMNITLQDIGVSSWDEVTCDSSMHNVSGSFYTDENGDLHEGYPC